MCVCVCVCARVCVCVCEREREREFWHHSGIFVMIVVVLIPSTYVRKKFIVIQTVIHLYHGSMNYRVCHLPR